MQSTNVFVINLEQQPKRRALMTAQLDAAGMRGEIIQAVDGRRLSPSELSMHLDSGGGEQHEYPLTRGEIGCALSHQIAYRRIIDQRLPWGVVMEDDILIGRDFLPVLDAVAQHIDSERPQICLFSHIESYTNWGRRRLPRRRWLVKAVRAHGGRCYLVTAAAAKLLLQLNHPIRLAVDSWIRLRDLGGLDVHAIVPYCIGYPPCEQDSVIEPERTARDANKTVTRSQRIREGLHRIFYRKIIYQLGVKQLLRIHKQRDIW